MAGCDSFHFLISEIYPMLRKMEEILSIIGLFYMTKITVSTFIDILVGAKCHLYSRIWSKNFVSKYGKWAAVTGCTDGIGKAYAEELAKEGMNLILISRNLEKLAHFSKDLVQKYNVKTEIVQVDFSDGSHIYDTISESFKHKEVGLVVNNVGIMLPYPKYFNEVSYGEIWGHVNVNVASVCCMTKLALENMEKRGRGAIVNIASIACSGPIPLMGIYAASKAFVDSFSQSLEWECRQKGITVQTVTPSYVATNMTSFSSWISTANLITPSAAVFASHAVRTIGYSKRTTGYWVHGIQMWFVEKVMSKWSFMFVMDLAQKFLRKNMKKDK